MLTNGLKFLECSDKHPLNTINGDAYFNTTENATYVNVQNIWIKMEPVKSSNEFLLEERRIKLNRIKNKMNEC